MIHFQQSIQNTKGDALIGYFVKLADTSDNSAIPIYADSSLTPISSVSGLDNACLVDSDGMADFWGASGTYHMDIYATDGTTLQERKTFVQFGVPDGTYGDVTVAGDTWTIGALSSVNITGGSITGITDLAIADGGTGASTASGARTNLGVPYGTASDLLAGTATAKIIAPDQFWAAAATVVLTDGATITPDLSTGVNFSVTLGGSRTLANPTNVKTGQSGLLIITQDATGSRVLTYGTKYKFPGGAATGGVLSTAASTVDVISYYVRSNGDLLCTLAKAFA